MIPLDDTHPPPLMPAPDDPPLEGENGDVSTREKVLWLLAALGISLLMWWGIIDAGCRLYRWVRHMI